MTFLPTICNNSTLLISSFYKIWCRRRRPRKWPKTAKEHWENSRSRGVYQSIWKILKGETIEISVPSQPAILFSLVMAPKGPFGPFFGPEWVWGQYKNANLGTTPKLLVKMGPTQLDY